MSNTTDYVIDFEHSEEVTTDLYDSVVHAKLSNMGFNYGPWYSSMGPLGTVEVNFDDNFDNRIIVTQTL